MTGPREPTYVPPTTTGQAVQWPPPGAPAGQYPPPPPGYVVYTRPRPQQLGLAAGCTIAVGVLSILLGAVTMLGVLFASYWIEYGLAFARPYGPVPTAGSIIALAVVIAVIPLVFGAFAVSSGSGLNAGRPSAWTGAVVVNILSVALSLFTVWGFVGLLHGIPSGIALWALFQADVRAYFGH